MQNKLTDINAVCDILGCTSRTLRFYEQKEIIQSTTLPFSNRRQYSYEQIEQIKKVLVLRSLGLSIAKIQELQSNTQTLESAISDRKAELIASVVAKNKEYNLLCEALLKLESGEDIFAEETISNTNFRQNYLFIVESFTDCFLNGFYERCFECFSDILKDYLPLSAFERVISDTLKPVGEFIEKDRIEKDKELHNVFYSYLKYEKIGLYIKLAFAKDKVNGIWLNYYYYEEK